MRLPAATHTQEALLISTKERKHLAGERLRTCRMSSRHVCTLIALALTTVSCSRQGPQTTSSNATTKAPAMVDTVCTPQTTELLKDRTYVVNRDHLLLKDGQLVSKGHDGAMEAGLWTSENGVPFTACGQLSGDGVSTNVVALYESDGGSALTTYIVPVLMQQGQLVNGAAFQLGDRIDLKRISIDGGRVVIDYVGHGPDDPLCCGTVAKTIKLRLVGKTLVCADKACQAKSVFG